MVDYILYENATGYALFKVAESEQVASFAEQYQQSVTDMGRFSRIVNLFAFLPFKTSEEALENINAVSEGALHATLLNFLEANCPKGSKLGVSEDKLAGAIQESLGFNCVKGKQVLELSRGIRAFFEKFVKELKSGDLEKAQLGLGHSYSRSKVKFNINRADNMVIQAICLLDQLDKDVNTFAMRVREWYSWHFPELVTVVPDNYQFARCAKIISDKSQLTADQLPQLEEIVGDADKAKEILEAAKTSMGFEISQLDMLSINQFADRVIHLSEYRTRLHEYLAKKMRDIAPNLSSLIGETVGARLISHAGSLTNLAKYPASTVQILGAEKALFRALKTRGNTPKYGLIYHSSFIGRATAKNKGRISRYLANKASIASRIDSFTEEPTTKFGEMLKEQVEERLKFYDEGTAPRKNIDCMKQVIEEMAQEKENKPEEEQPKRTPNRRSTPARKRTSKAAEEATPMEEEAEEPAKKKKTPAKKTPVKKAAAEEEAEEEAPVKKTPAKKKTPVKKAVVEEEAEEEEAPAKKTLAKKKTPVKKTPAKKTPKKVVEEEAMEEDA
eukprot:TRINITY_DN18473_c0_g1_i1.p1 TRINITY_DN18473_c0_g1~~TRINITY_DN18473_c0_g1_i1.p1  ORF type:complete len:576 (-),score=214.90 TRINITY_DN18473_c0_g1_i1:1304-2977(-)